VALFDFHKADEVCKLQFQKRDANKITGFSNADNMFDNTLILNRNGI
jgi:hypothetical protein